MNSRKTRLVAFGLPTLAALSVAGPLAVVHAQSGAPNPPITRPAPTPAGNGSPASPTPLYNYQAQAAGADVDVATKNLDRAKALYQAGAISAADLEEAEATAAAARANAAIAGRQSDEALRQLQAVTTHRDKLSDLAAQQYKAGVASADALSAVQDRAAQARVRADLYSIVVLREQALDRTRALYQQGQASAADLERATAALQGALARFAAETQGVGQSVDSAGSVRKVPLLGDLPLVGSLFRTPANAPARNSGPAADAAPGNPGSRFSTSRPAPAAPVVPGTAGSGRSTPGSDAPLGR